VIYAAHVRFTSRKTGQNLYRRIEFPAPSYKDAWLEAEVYAAARLPGDDFEVVVEDVCFVCSPEEDL
jgi:hypothetical protein